MSEIKVIDSMTLEEQRRIKELADADTLDEKYAAALLPAILAKQKQEAFADYGYFAKSYIKITDKNGNRVRFEHNSVQRSINYKVKKLHEAGKPVRIIILKARQEGVSTNEQGRMLYNTITHENRNGLIVAHEAKSTSVIFEKAKYMLNNLPPEIMPLIKATNAQELVFDKPYDYRGKENGLHSKISIQVAGNTSIGRSDTIHYAHISEFAFFPSPEGKSPIKQLNGILEAVPSSADTEVIIESTANGVNDFKELWDAAVSGQNEWVPLFFAWFADKSYQMSCTEEDYQRRFDSLDTKMQLYLAHIKKFYKLSKEQIYWYIWKYKNNCNSDHNMMKQENPTFPEEAFLATGTPVFDNDKINTRIAALRRKYKTKPPLKGRLSFEWANPERQDAIKDESIKFVNDTNGFITIYEPPQEGVPYVIGGDTKGESTNSDKYAATVINNVTGNRAAVLHGQWTQSKPYTHQMYCLGMYYNMALIGIETNWNTAPIEELERLHYSRQFTRRRYDDYTHEYKTSYGFKTDGNSRPNIIDKEIALVESNIDLFNDIEMLIECLTFVYVDGRPDAQSGKHDDILFSDMIANEIRPQQSFEAEIEVVRKKYNFDNEFDGFTPEGEKEIESPFD